MKFLSHSVKIKGKLHIDATPAFFLVDFRLFERLQVKDMSFEKT